MGTSHARQTHSHRSSRDQAGCVPVRRRDDGSWEVLLVSASSDSALFVLPKGSVERGEKCKDAAQRETEEEAGVVGALRKGSLGKFEYCRGGQDYVLKSWLLDVHEEYESNDARWKERARRDRRWLPFADAHALVADGERRGKPRPEVAIMLQLAEVALRAPEDTVQLSDD